MSLFTIQPASDLLPARKSIECEPKPTSADTLPDITLPEISDVSPAAQASRPLLPLEIHGNQNGLTLALLVQLTVLLALLIMLKDKVLLAYAIEHVLLAVVGTVMFLCWSRRLGSILLLMGTIPMLTVLPFLVGVAWKLH